jgi:aminomuconate-semialdehyde/2-hydroxymuconate-6-semialdehyde dehydrogenase
MMKPAHFVAGEFCTDGESFPLIDPVVGSQIGTVPEAPRELVDEAVGAARSALAGEWADAGVAGRAAVLRRIANVIEARFEDFVDAEVSDTGRPRELAATIDVPRAVANFRSYADLLYGRGERAYVAPDSLNYTVHRPLGVVAVVSPWNLPLLLLSWKVAPALAAGNAVVAKPSEETPSSATLLAEVTAEAGLPAGVFNLVHGHGAGAAGEHLTAHPGVDAIAFTGESATGATIMRGAASHVTPVSFELGGKNPALIFADADFDRAVAGTARSAFTHSGQICLCTERVYVQRPIFDSFVAALGARAGALRGYGPMISAAHRDKVLSYYRMAAGAGATVVVGGGVPRFDDERDGGFFVEPTVLTGLPEHARPVREEIFGPVCHIAPFDTEGEAIRLANDSRYGLAATLWTSDVSRAHRLAPRIQAGIVWVNCWNLRDLRTPFGGLRASGIGREGGEHSLDFFSAPVNVCVGL